MAVFNVVATNDDGGQDVIYNNDRVRATRAPITLTAALGGSTLPANPLGTGYLAGTGAPISTAPSGATTITAAQLGAGIITMAPSTGITATFDTGANMVAYLNQTTAGAQVGDYFQCLIVNGQATNVITLAVPGSGNFDANQAARTIPVSSSKYMYIRITNVTPGSEAYVVYF